MTAAFASGDTEGLEIGLMLGLALTAIDSARDRLARYALATDWPALGAVEAADLLDAARAALARGVAE